MSGQNTHLEIAALKQPNLDICFRTVPVIMVDDAKYLFPLAEFEYKKGTSVVIKMDLSKQFAFLMERPLWKIQCCVCSLYKHDISFSKTGIPFQCTDCLKSNHAKRYCPRSLCCYLPAPTGHRACCGLCEWHEMVNHVSWNLC